MIISAGVAPEVLSGSKMVLAVADEMGATVGDIGRWAFLIGFWGAVFSSMLGVWQGVPYLFADFVHEWRNTGDAKVIDTGSVPYRAYLAYLAAMDVDLPAIIERGDWLLPIRRVEAEYLRPLRFGQQVSADLVAARCRAPSCRR